MNDEDIAHLRISAQGMWMQLEFWTLTKNLDPQIVARMKSLAEDIRRLYGRSKDEVGRVYETRWDCCTARRKAA